jgi:PAS domain S-box-containing protein
VTDDDVTGFTGSLLETIGDAVVVVGRAGDIVHVDRRTEELLGWAGSDLMGRPVEVLVPEGLRDVHARHRVEYFESLAETGSTANAPVLTVNAGS